MTDVTTIDQYPKASYTKQQVDTIRQDRLSHGAKSCDETDDTTNYTLTTVWPGNDAGSEVAAAAAHASAAAAHASAASAHANVASLHASRPKPVRAS